jgi:hypothetical protein
VVFLKELKYLMLILILQNLNEVTSGDAAGYLTVIQDIMDKNLADDQVKTKEFGTNGAGTDSGRW